MTQSLLNLYSENSNRYCDTDKENPSHHYISKCYSDLFEPYKNKDINFLEIGLGSGGSLLLWNDFFENSKIYGIDSGTDPRFRQCIERVKPYPKINLICSDAYDHSLVENLPQFDIIIDDGPHTFQSHLKCLVLYLPKLKNGGVLILEDIENYDYIKEYIRIAESNSSKIECSVVDTDRQLEYNNLLLVIKKYE